MCNPYDCKIIIEITNNIVYRALVPRGKKVLIKIIEHNNDKCEVCYKPVLIQEVDAKEMEVDEFLANQIDKIRKH